MAKKKEKMNNKPRKFNPVFAILISLCCGLIFGSFSYSTNNNIQNSLIVGGIATLSCFLGYLAHIFSTKP
jgi:hypothetical protein